MSRLATLLCGLLIGLHSGSTRAEDIEAELLRECVVLAKMIEKSVQPVVVISDLEPLVTWRASCAEKPPTGKGQVTALCNGKATKPDGTVQSIFFWSKEYHKKLNTGYYWCDNHYDS